MAVLGCINGLSGSDAKFDVFQHHKSPVTAIACPGRTLCIYDAGTTTVQIFQNDKANSPIADNDWTLIS